MQLFKLASALALFAGAAVAQTYHTTATFSFDYDNGSSSTNSVACSELTAEFPTLGSFPTFPSVGGAFAVSGFGSPKCGSCWQITDPTTDVTLYFTAIDTSGVGFDLSEQAFNTLTDGGNPLNRVNVTAELVAASYCGL